MRAVGIDRRDGLADREVEPRPGVLAHVARQGGEGLRHPLPLLAAQEADLPLGDRAVGDDVHLPVGAQEGGVGGEVVDEGGVAGDQAADVDRRAPLAARMGLDLAAPAGGGDQRRAPLPVVEARMGGAAVRFEPPVEHAAAAGDQGLGALRGRLPGLEHPEGARPLA